MVAIPPLMVAIPPLMAATPPVMAAKRPFNGCNTPFSWLQYPLYWLQYPLKWLQYPLKWLQHPRWWLQYTDATAESGEEILAKSWLNNLRTENCVWAVTFLANHSSGNHSEDFATATREKVIRSKTAKNPTKNCHEVTWKRCVLGSIYIYMRPPYIPPFYIPPSCRGMGWDYSAPPP